MTGNSSSLARRVMGLIVPLVFLLSCWGEGKDQLHGMYNISFSSTAVCNAQVQLIPFRNVSGTEIVIEGAAISRGTDPSGNFTLTAIKIGEEEIPAVTGILNDIHIPSGANYSFVITYTPWTENATHTAVLDIAYREPQEGIIQINLSGTSTNRLPTCPSGGGSVGPGAGNLNGAMTITINRIALVSSALSQPISTDPDATETPFNPVTLPITFEEGTNEVTLPAIPESVQFLLPRAKMNPLHDLIQSETLVTSRADVTGTYGDDGSIELRDIPIHLKECFEVDFIVTLTTGEVSNPGLDVSILRAGDFNVTDDQDGIYGSPVNAETFETTLVGISTFSSPTGSCNIVTSIGDTTGAVVINATVNPPSSS